MVKRKEAFVTGAAGMLGSHLVEHLLEKKYKVTCLVHPRDKKDFLQTLDVDIVEGNILDMEFPFTKGSTVFHCAALTPGMKAPAAAYKKVNFTGTKKVADAANKAQVETFVYVSSGAVFGEKNKGYFTEDAVPLPDTPYGESKLQAEWLLRPYKAKFRVVIVRPFLVYGERMAKWSASARLFRHAHRKVVPVVDKGVYEFSYVKNVVEGIVLAAEQSHNVYDIFHVSDGHRKSFAKIIRSINAKAFTISVPYSFLKFSSKIGESLSLPFRKRTLRTMVGGKRVVSEKIKELGFEKIYTLEESVKRTKKSLKI